MARSSMPDQPASPPEEWFQKAREDLEAAELLLAHRGPAGSAAFHVQQAIEKAIKGFLIARGWELRRIHNLDPLLKDAGAHDPDLEQFHELCLKVSQFYFDERYPGLQSSGLTAEEVREALEAAKPLLNKLMAS